MFFRVFVFVLLLPAIATSYTVVRKDGKTFSGTLIQQTSQETIIKDREGVTLKFHSHQIDWDQTTLQIQKQEAEMATPTRSRDQSFETREITTRKQWTGEPFSFDFKDIDIRDLFRFIADISGLNVILDPSVNGSITLKLQDVPWDQALDLITKNQGLGYTVEGNVIRIAPYSKILQEERARLEAERQKILSASLVTVMIPLSYARAIEMEQIVRKMLTPKGTTIVDQRTNMLIVTDIETNIDTVLSYFPATRL